MRAGGALLALAVLPAMAVAQGGVVAGRVLSAADTAAASPAPDAAISIVGTPLIAVAGADGRFVIERVPAGRRTVRVRLLGHRTTDRELDVRAGDTVFVEITLQREARMLPAVRADARPEDVELFVAKPNVGTITLGARAMAGLPKVGEPDVVRIAQLLPGVVARNDFNTGLNVRGGEADQNLVLLDGLPIYNPFHLGGLFSTFMDATVGGIELVTAAFHPRFGGRLSSVLDVRSASETRGGVNVTADISALGTSAKLGGIVGNGRGMWSVAARRTYADAAARLFTENIFPYHFRDMHARAAYVLPRDVRVAITAYGGRDVLASNLAEFESDSATSKAGRGTWNASWGNRVIGGSIAKDVGRATLEQRVSTSAFSTSLDLGGGASSQLNSIRDVRAAGSLLVRSAAHDVAAGYEAARHRVHYASGSSQTGTTEFDFIQRPTAGALWVSDLWRLSPRWLVESGVRGEALTGRDFAALSPRLSVKFFATPELAFTAAAGRVTQWLHSLAGDGPLRYFDIWLASDSLTPVASAWHWVAGAERRFGDNLSVRVESYLKRYDRVLEANWSEDPQRRGDEFFVAEGRSYGTDLHTRWRTANGPSGWVAYSYGLSYRSRDGARWAPGHDRRHDLDVALTWLVRKYQLGARFGYATGTPYTPIVGEIARRVYDPSLDEWGTGDAPILRESIAGARHGERFPPTQRLDLDVSRAFTLRGATWSPYVSVANAYNAKNVFVYLYEYSTDQPYRRAISQFPVLPSVGVRIAF